MLDMIIMATLILGIAIVKIENKKKRRVFKMVGLMLIVLSLIYIVPSFFNGFCKGFLDTALMTN